MTEDQRSIASFVIRFTQHLWDEPDGQPNIQWRGNIRHVQGEEEKSFTELSDALAFIQKHLTQLTMDSTAGKSVSEKNKVLSQSFKLWEKLAESYSDMIMESLQKAYEESGTLTKQIEANVEKAYKSWGISPLAGEGEILKTLEDITLQVQELIRKVNMLS